MTHPVAFVATLIAAFASAVHSPVATGSVFLRARYCRSVFGLAGCGADAPPHDDFIHRGKRPPTLEGVPPWFDDMVPDESVRADAEFCLLGGDLAGNGTPAQLT
jgi:hypothetical protein